MLPCHRICQLWKIRDLEKDGVEWFERIEIHSCILRNIRIEFSLLECFECFDPYRFPRKKIHVEVSDILKLLPWSKDQYGGLTSVGGMFGRSGQFQLPCRSRVIHLCVIVARSVSNAVACWCGRVQNSGFFSTWDVDIELLQLLLHARFGKCPPPETLSYICIALIVFQGTPETSSQSKCRRRSKNPEGKANVSDPGHDGLWKCWSKLVKGSLRVSGECT